MRLYDLQADSEITAIDVDRTNGYIYWVTGGSGNIYRRDYTLGVVEGRSSAPSDAFDLQVAPGKDKIYWAEGTSNLIRRCNLDGSGVETVIEATSLGCFSVYTWIDEVFYEDDGEIWRASTEGAGTKWVLTLFDGLSTRGMALIYAD